MIWKIWQTNFWQAWSNYLGKAVPSDVVCFNSGSYLLSGHQMTCRSTQGVLLSLRVCQTPLFRFICLAFAIGQAGNRCQVSSTSYCWAHVPTHVILFALAKWESPCMLQNSWFQLTETQFKKKLTATETLRDVSYFRWIQELKSCQQGLTLSPSPPSFSFPEPSHPFLALLFYM